MRLPGLKAASSGSSPVMRFGSLVEFQAPEQIRREYPDGVRELADGGTWNAIPAQWTECVLNCRPAAGQPHVRRPRPECFWPVDALALAERLIVFD
jgi:hypothetical protein